MELTHYAIIALGISAGAIAKGATGMGLPLVAVPVLASFLGLQHAVGIMVIPILVSNIWQCWRFRAEVRDARVKFLVPMLAGGMGGVILGTWFLAVVPQRELEITLGVLLIGYLALRLMRPDFIVSKEAGQKAALPIGIGAGALHGATGISAPIGVTFIHAMRLEREPHVFAVSAMFLAFAIVQLPALFIAGIMEPFWVVEGILALIPIALFMPVGQFLAGKLSRAAFDKMILIFLGVIGIKLALGL